MEIVDMLRAAPVFEDLTARGLRRLAKASRVRDYRRGQVIFRQGAESFGFFVIVSGSVKVVRNPGKSYQAVLATLGPGE